jgi:DNA uptake protein ComE-like DNA-binding protein
MDRIQVNLANPLELLEIPGIGGEQAQRIVKFRAEHGPIRDAVELSRVVGGEHVDFDPAQVTAPEAPGA